MKSGFGSPSSVRSNKTNLTKTIVAYLNMVLMKYQSGGYYFKPANFETISLLNFFVSLGFSSALASAWL